MIPSPNLAKANPCILKLYVLRMTLFRRDLVNKKLISLNSFQPQTAYSCKSAYFFISKPICLIVSHNGINTMSRQRIGPLIFSDYEENVPTTSFNYLALNSFFLICQRSDSCFPLLLRTYLELKHHLFTK